MSSPPDKARSPLIAQLGLAPHVEGGYYRELWRSEGVLPKSLLGERYTGARASASSIYFLLPPGEVSRWHVIASAELWLHHLDSSLTLTLGGSGDEPCPLETFLTCIVSPAFHPDGFASLLSEVGRFVLPVVLLRLDRTSRPSVGAPVA